MPGRRPNSPSPELLWCAAPALAGATLSLAAPLAPAPPAQPAQDEPPKQFAPIAYFASSCASCHGPYGSFYGPNFGRGMTDDELRRKVEDMVFGPSQDTLEPADLDRLTAYHRSLILRAPFIALVDRSGDRLAGEVTPGATVRARVGDRSFDATVKGHAWTIDLEDPPGAAQPVLVAVAAAPGPDGKPVQTTLDLDKTGFSHAEPLPKPADKAPTPPP